jgi:hypothetical protein
VLWAADPTIGTWKLNLAKSKFYPGPAFRSDTRIYEEVPDGIKVTIITVDASGKTVRSEYPVNYDGKFHPVSGQGGPADAVALKRINAYVSETSLMHAGRITATARRVVSVDGKTMTVSYKGLDPEGRNVDYTLVYEKQ